MTVPVRGEQDLQTLLGSLAPRLDAELYWFCHLPAAAIPAGVPVLARVDEDEGATIVTPAGAAEAAGLTATFVARRIVLTVHSDLGAVGMMAAVATALAERGLPCNVFAGIYHDHLFVAPDDAPRAISALEELQASAHSGVRIAYLADHPAAIEQLGEWHYAEWRHLIPGWSVGEAAAELASHRGRRMIPTTFVALRGIEIVGSASLLVDDMPGTDAWSPWLASVYVAPGWRGRGIGRRLVQRAIADADALNVPVLHLFTTEAEEWYLAQGWRVVNRLPHEGQAATIMDLDLRRERSTFQLQEPTPWRRTVSEWSDRWQAILSDFERQRDELKVRVQLAKSEAREEMAKLESRMDALRVKAQSAGSEAKDAMRDIGGAAEELANEIRIGLDRIRKTL
jgi:GNAT superfamily N-acetyltransferase